MEPGRGQPVLDVPTDGLGGDAEGQPAVDLDLAAAGDDIDLDAAPDEPGGHRRMAVEPLAVAVQLRAPVVGHGLQHREQLARGVVGKLDDLPGLLEGRRHLDHDVVPGAQAPVARGGLGDEPELALPLLADPYSRRRLGLADHAGVPGELRPMLEQPSRAPRAARLLVGHHHQGHRALEGDAVLVQEEAGEEGRRQPTPHVGHTAPEDPAVLDPPPVGRERPQRGVVGREVVEVAVEDEAGTGLAPRQRADQAHVRGARLEALDGQARPLENGGVVVGNRPGVAGGILRRDLEAVGAQPRQLVLPAVDLGPELALQQGDAVSHGMWFLPVGVSARAGARRRDGPV